MKIYIQSKSGDLNAAIKWTWSSGLLSERKAPPLKEVLKSLKENGGYPAQYQKKDVFVPFEEILYIKEYNEEIV